MAKFKGKSKWKSILCGILVVATLIGACAGIAAISKKETKTISSLSFTRGMLDEEGIYQSSETSIFTEDMFECMGLVIEPDVKFTSEYQVFFYNFDGVFLSSSEKYTKTTRLEVPELAKYARVVIYTDEEISFWGVNKVARTLDIKVDKEQNFELYNHFSLDETNPDKVVTYDINGAGLNYSQMIKWFGTDSESNVSATGWSPVLPIRVNGWNNVYLKFNDAADAKDLIYFFTKVNADGVEEIVPAGSMQSRLNGGLVEVIIEVPEGAQIFHTNTLTDAKHHYVINQYN